MALTQVPAEMIGLSALVPAGVYLPFGGSTAPTGWLTCDGSAISRTTYSKLFEAIGTAYGAGNGSTTFNLPNMADRIPVGKSGSRSLGATGGASSVTLAIEHLPAHNHGVNDPGHSHGVSDPSHRHADRMSYGHDDNNGTNGNDAGYNLRQSSDSPNHNMWGYSEYSGVGIGIYGSGTGISTQNTGSGSAVSVEQPWTCCHYIIKY